MQLGFVSAILPDLDVPQVFDFAKKQHYSCVEIMCWPLGRAKRRYAGITHIDVNKTNAEDISNVKQLQEKSGVSISALGYYPNPLTPDLSESNLYVEHIKKVIVAAAKFEIGTVNTFIGRDWKKTIDENWPRFLDVWKPLIALAEDHGIKVGIENCPMSFTVDEWPGGKNLASTPAIWRRMFEDIPSDSFGLNFDPSHFIWQQMDYAKAMKEFGHKLFHVHAKDVKIKKEALNEVGIMAFPLEYHIPKLPGLGDVNWDMFFSTLSEIEYEGPVCVEVEDRDYEGSLENRKKSLMISEAFLKPYFLKSKN